MHINLQHTLDSGQIFRYHKENDGYRIIHHKHAFFVSIKNNKLFSKDIPIIKCNNFFRLDDDYEQVKNKINKDKTIGEAISKYKGLRLLRQDPWECTVSFMCATATNIPRIKRDLNNIAEKFGEQKNEFHLFPKIGEIDSVKKLQQCGTGYRAKYIHAVNNMLTVSFFRKLKKQSYEDAKIELMKLPGIGPKVADCILLFSLDYLNSFPIDTWTEKVIKENYTKGNQKQLAEFAQNYFSPYAGYAQQFLYHWRRKEK
jgi:N-glycosylase/DNA lyase